MHTFSIKAQCLLFATVVINERAKLFPACEKNKGENVWIKESMADLLKSKSQRKGPYETAPFESLYKMFNPVWG